MTIKQALEKQNGKSKLTIDQQERVVRALSAEYAYLGVTPEAAIACVAKGDWDDHPAATGFHAMIDE